MGDVLLCLTNTKPHPVTPTTSIHYIKQKIMGAPGTTCRLKLQRNGVIFEVDLKRSAFSQPVLPFSNDSGSGNRVLKEEMASTKAETNVRGVVSSCAADLTAQRMSVSSSVSSRASGSGGDTCGVGLRLTKDANGNIVIAELAPGGPAHLSGNVMEGDVILCLQNKYPHEIKPSTSIEYVQRKMRGRPGKSDVYLLYYFKRTNTDANARLLILASRCTAGAQFTCFTGTKVQTLTPSSLRAREHLHTYSPAKQQRRQAGRPVRSVSHQSSLHGSFPLLLCALPAAALQPHPL